MLISIEFLMCISTVWIKGAHKNHVKTCLTRFIAFLLALP